ncbi:VOC family protein [Pelagibacterium limicola]|uniref:VOC family protein n=1 Tax=Pelagibacterium limicola TaxID=2791022 RepID=UPI0018AFA66D|nr:VOC family protein [Pelagibacterium limicola]
MTKLVHFELTASDAEMTARFYSDILGWTAGPSPHVPNYMLLSGNDGATGAVMSDRYQSQPAILWFEVADIDFVLSSIAKNGGKQQGDINTIPGQGRVVYASDPNGTIFGLKQPK